jgi:hypothetical protein
MAQYVFSVTLPRGLGWAAQIDQIGALSTYAGCALRIPCVGDELMGFPEEYLRKH